MLRYKYPSGFRLQWEIGKIGFLVYLTQKYFSDSKNVWESYILSYILYSKTLITDLKNMTHGHKLWIGSFAPSCGKYPVGAY